MRPPVSMYPPGSRDENGAPYGYNDPDEWYCDECERNHDDDYVCARHERALLFRETLR